MAGLSSSLTLPKLGNTSVSSLIKSASTLSNELDTYNDDVQKINFNNDPSDANLQSYTQYLNGRITNLQSTGTISDATKALTLSTDFTSAVNKNVSFNVTTIAGQVLAGNMTDQDKLNYLQGAYGQVLSTGDTDAATSIQNEAYTLSQKIQYDAQTAATAAQTLAGANATSDESVATTLTNQLKQLNKDIQMTGQKGMNGAIQNWVKTNSAQFAALGVKLDPGAQPNYFDIVNGVGAAIYNAHVLAYQSELPYDPQTAQKYLTSAQDLNMGIDTLPTLAGSKTTQQIQAAAANPAEFSYDEASGKLIQNEQTGFKGYDQNGQPQATYSGSAKQTVYLSPQQTTMMTKLGLQFTETTTGPKKGTTGNGVEVQVGPSSPTWLKQVLGPNGVTSMYSTPQGLQFEADTSTGKGYYSLAEDSNGLVAPYLHTPDGKVTAMAGQYGFNQKVNTMVSGGTVQQLQQQAQAQAAQQSMANIKGQNDPMSKAIQNLTAAGAANSIKSGIGSTPVMSQRAGGGFNFTYQGQAISAARYSQLTGTQFRTLLTQMATAGDSGAKSALQFVGNDFGYDPTKAVSYQNAGTYNALTYGVGVKPLTDAAPASVLGNGAQLKF